MTCVYKTIRFFVVVMLWSNFVVASEYRSFPVPKYKTSHSSSFNVLPLLCVGKLSGIMSHIHLPNFGKLFDNIDFSSGTKIVQEHKMILGAATTVIFLSLLVKQLQKSELCGKWLHEKYNAVGTSVDSYTNDCIEACPTSVQYALTPLKVVIQYLCNAIKRYVAMNKTTIVGSVVAPVTGRVLDTVFVCPIPLLNFTSIGCMASGGILTKGYFDSHFEKMGEKLDGIDKKIDAVDKQNTTQHTATQEKIGLVQSTIDIMKDNINQLFDKINDLSTGVGQIKQQVGSVSEQVKGLLSDLTGIGTQVTLLHKKIDQQGKKGDERYEALMRELEELQKSQKTAMDLLHEKIQQNEALMLELQGFKSTYESNHAGLRKDLSLTAMQLSSQIDNIQKTLDGRLGLPNNGDHNNNCDRNKDMQIKLLKWQVGQTGANNS